MRDTKVDMLHGPLSGKLFWFALPIAASSMLQQLFNAADTAVVGKFADAAALAAVGTNGEIVAFIVSLSAGLSVGTNVLLGMCIGKGEKKDIQGVIQTAMVLALAVGLVGLLLGQVVARPILVLIHTPEEILDLAVQYLRIYCLGYPALLVYDFGSAILRSKGDSRRPFLILTFSGFINVGLNLFFVIVCGLGVAGVMRGMGYSLRPALMTMLGICLFRIVWVETVFRQVRTMPCLFIVFPITWAITLVLIWGTFRLVAWDKLKGNEGSAA